MFIDDVCSIVCVYTVSLVHGRVKEKKMHY